MVQTAEAPPPPKKKMMPKNENGVNFNVSRTQTLSNTTELLSRCGSAQTGVRAKNEARTADGKTWQNLNPGFPRSEKTC